MNAQQVQESFVARLLKDKTHPTDRIVYNLLAISLGVILLSALAQVAIRLPFTPVPITGQTFGVALVALLWGRARGVAIMTIYFLLGGVFELPVFAMGKFGLAWGPTMGYLIGMIFASVAMGTLANRGWTNSFWKTYFAAFIGSVITFACGLLVLSKFVPAEALLISGLWPFLPGDFIKSMLAAALVSQANKRLKR